MKRITTSWLAALLLPLAFGACQNDDITTDDTPADDAPLTVRATIGNPPQSRAQVKWGNGDTDAGEIFMWNKGDAFKVFDMGVDYLDLTTFTISPDYDEANPSASAEFTCPAGTTFDSRAMLAAFYCNVTPTTDAYGDLTFTYHRPAAWTQTQTATPGHADLAHLKDALWMYDIRSTDEQGKPGAFEFSHFSSLIRITVTNTTDAAKEIKRVECNYGNPVVIDQTGINKSSVFDNTSKISASTIDLHADNGNGYATIGAKGSYDIFIPEIFDRQAKAKSMTITLTYSDDTRQSVTIAGFTDQLFKAGYRYWFDLTITADGLRQTAREPYAWYTANPSAATFTLATPAELREFAALVNGDAEALTATGETSAVRFSGKTVRIADGITTLDLEGKEWTPVGTPSASFRGTFDGNGATVSGLTVNVASGDYAGFFGYTYNATVRNLHVTGSITAENSQYVGGIAGQAGGSSCVIENCLFSGTVKGKMDVGGIAGFNYNGSRITACFSSGSVDAMITSGIAAAGGIAGENSGSATITHCYSSTEVTAKGSVAGGIAGLNIGSTVSSCYATGSVSATSQTGGIAGRNEAILTNCLALSSVITRTGSGTSTDFGRVAGSNTSDNGITNCAAYAAMTLPSDVTPTSDPGSIHGSDLDRAACLTTAPYTSRGLLTTPPPTDPLTPAWSFDPQPTWTHLPWLKVLYDYWGDATLIPVPAQP